MNNYPGPVAPQLSNPSRTLRRLDLPQRVQFAINIAMAASMLAVVALAALAPR